VRKNRRNSFPVAVHGTAVAAALLLALGSCATGTQAEEREVAEGCFYEGLLRLADGDEAAAVELFEGALEGPNPRVAAAAAAELLRLHLSAGLDLGSRTQAAIGAAADGPWASVFAIVGGSGSRGEFLDFALGPEASGDTLGALADWLTAEGDALGLSPDERAAVSGRVAASRSRWGEALSHFRVALDIGPDVFLAYPSLLGDLGRAFQFAGTGPEGVNLFLEWEAAYAIPAGVDANEIRFRLLFFAGRIARQRGMESIALFERALPFARAVSPAQSDATVWHILREASDGNTADMISLLDTHAAGWHGDAGFFDVMDRLSRRLIMEWDWEGMIRAFAAVQGRESMITAKFAWILARAVEEGFVPAERVRVSLSLPAREDPTTALLRIAHRTSGRSLYYRLMSANALGLPFLPPPRAETRGDVSEAAQFLLGFFDHGAEAFALRHVRGIEESLAIEDIRLVSEAFAGTGDFLNSILLYTRFARRDGFDLSMLTRRDWELWYPAPFADLIEANAVRVGIEPHLMFALVRAESAFMPAIGSHAGARGLSQLMPATAVEIAARILRQGGPDFRTDMGEGELGLDLTDPYLNLFIGTTYLGILMNERFGDPLLALMAYNAGTGRVRQWRTAALRALGFDLPTDVFLETVLFPETRNYGRGVTAAMEVYRQLWFADSGRRVAGR